MDLRRSQFMLQLKIIEARWGKVGGPVPNSKSMDGRRQEQLEGAGRPLPKPTSVRQFFKLFSDDGACLKHLFEVRFGQGHKCPKCEREARWYPIKAELAFSCQWCGHHIHPMVGTIFEKSRTPLQMWFYVIFKFTQTRHGVSAKEVERELSVTYKTAWRMCQMIRHHMAEIDGEDPLGGAGFHVEVDETVVGGYRKAASAAAQARTRPSCSACFSATAMSWSRSYPT